MPPPPYSRSLFVVDRNYFEQLERVSLSQHKSQYPHAVQWKAPLQMMILGDLWNYSLSALESYHAEVGRVADKTACKRVLADVGDGRTLTCQPSRKGEEGPAGLVLSRVETTMAGTIAERLIAAQSLRRDEELAIPMREAMRIELAPELGGGRSALPRLHAKMLSIVVDPNTTCVLEFAKLL